MSLPKSEIDYLTVITALLWFWGKFMGRV